MKVLKLYFLAFISGIVVIAGELLYPRIAAVWFGNTLLLWCINLAFSLLVLATGYYTSAYILRKGSVNISKFLFGTYILSGLFYILIALFHNVLLDKLILLDSVSGAILFAIIMLVPTMGVLAMSSPFIVELYRVSTEKSNGASVIFSISTFSGAFGMLIIGLYAIPFLGIKITCYMVSAFLFLNAVLSKVK